MISLGVVVVVVEVAIVVDKPSRLVVRWSGKLCWMARRSYSSRVSAQVRENARMKISTRGRRAAREKNL